jgi:hypothetical protein
MSRQGLIAAQGKALLQHASYTNKLQGSYQLNYKIQGVRLPARVRFRVYFGT